MKQPQFNHLIQMKKKCIQFILSYKKIILISMVFSFFLVSFSGWAIQGRDKLIADMQSAQKNGEGLEYVSPTPDFSLAHLGDVSDLDLGVLGASDSALTTVDTYPTMAPIAAKYYAPMPTDVPMPTYVPYTYPTSIPIPTATSVPDCSGTPMGYFSNVIVSSPISTVNNPVTVTVELRDCHNNFAPVSDDLTVSLQNSDGTARINGVNFPINIQSKDGKATFTVNSQINIKDTYIITNTTRSFKVTDPGNSNPSITFSANTAGNKNCTTAVGVPNFWYSIVTPSSTQTSLVGTPYSFNVNILDCNKNTVSSDESLNITLEGGDNSVTVNGHGLPFSMTANSGQANITLNSQNPGIVTVKIYDSSSTFYITDSNNHNPSVNFTSVSSPTVTTAPTLAQSNPTQTPTPASTQASAPSATTAPVPTSTSGPIPTNTPELHPQVT
jgi:hypothetical protein